MSAERRIIYQRSIINFLLAQSDLQINSNVKKLYEMILIDTVNKNEGNKVKLREEKIKERENIKLKVEEIEDRFANKDITTETFNNIINRYQVKRREINAEIENLNQIGDSLTNYIDDGLKMLLNLNSLFLNSD